MNWFLIAFNRFNAINKMQVSSKYISDIKIILYEILDFSLSITFRIGRASSSTYCWFFDFQSLYFSFQSKTINMISAISRFRQPILLLEIFTSIKLVLIHFVHKTKKNSVHLFYYFIIIFKTPRSWPLGNLNLICIGINKINEAWFVRNT